MNTIGMPPTPATHDESDAISFPELALETLQGLIALGGPKLRPDHAQALKQLYFAAVADEFRAGLITISEMMGLLDRLNEML